MEVYKKSFYPNEDAKGVVHITLKKKKENAKQSLVLSETGLYFGVV